MVNVRPTRKVIRYAIKDGKVTVPQLLNTKGKYMNAGVPQLTDMPANEFCRQFQSLLKRKLKKSRTKHLHYLPEIGCFEPVGQILIMLVEPPFGFRTAAERNIFNSPANIRRNRFSQFTDPLIFHTTYCLTIIPACPELIEESEVKGT
jgi:hypothetical protein